MAIDMTRPANTSAPVSDIESIEIVPSDNGYVVRCNYRAAPARGRRGDVSGYDEPETHVADSVDALHALIDEKFGGTREPMAPVHEEDEPPYGPAA